MKRFKRRKLNNKGISLVEILVTVVILALISAPIVDSFLSAIRVNSESRKIQNGTSVAQDTAEIFKVFDVNALVESYKTPSTTVNKNEVTKTWDFEGKDGVLVSYDENGIYTFSGIPMKGADGEDFIVDVKLDPTTYDQNQQDKIKINGQNLPVFSGLYGSDSIMLYKPYASSDETLKELFEGKLGAGEPSILADINNYKQRQHVKKVAYVDIDCTYKNNRYAYAVKIKIEYTYNNATTVVAEKLIEKTYVSSDKVHSAYMLCPIFDRYSTEIDDVFLSSDTIYIDYSYTGNLDKNEDLYFYIAEQNMSHIDPSDGTDSGIQQRLKLGNIYIRYYQRASETQADTSASLPYMGYNEYITNVDSYKLKVYTNVGKDINSIDEQYGLTYGDYNTGASIYDMKITVKLKGDDEIVATFNTAK